MRAILSRPIFALLLFSLPIFGLARAQTAPDIQALINQQLDAFAHDDADGAYALAAPALREQFPDAKMFLAMVKSAYAPIYRHRSVEFRDQAREGDEIRQGAVFVDNDNDVWGAVYTIQRQNGGDWKITGCVLMRSDETSM